MACDLFKKDLLVEDLERPDWWKPQGRLDSLFPLDKNENYEPVLSKLYREHFRELCLDECRAYPDLSALYKKLAQNMSLSPQNLLLTAGSDGAIRTVFQSCVERYDVVLTTNPTFLMYEVYAKMFGAKLELVDYQETDKGPQIIFEELCNRIEKGDVKLFCLPNPDSPTGCVLSVENVELLAKACLKNRTVMFVDEAYYPFSPVTSVGLVKDYPNLIVARTFSKAWGLAGIRAGFTISCVETAHVLHKTRPMYEINSIAEAILIKSLDFEAEVLASVERVNMLKNDFAGRLQSLGHKTFVGGGNFILVSFAAKRAFIIQSLKEKILFKPNFVHPSLRGFCRISIGPERVMDEVFSIIKCN